MTIFSPEHSSKQICYSNCVMLGFNPQICFFMFYLYGIISNSKPKGKENKNSWVNYKSKRLSTVHRCQKSKIKEHEHNKKVVSSIFNTDFFQLVSNSRP